MTPTDTLKHEHQIILHVLGGVERRLRAADGPLDLDPEWLEKLVDFIRNFADRCHHSKEEKLLFVKLQERGMPRETGPIAVMLHEHQLGREFVATAADALPGARGGDAAAVATAREALLGYVALLTEHISKEDEVLYPMANRVLTPQDQQELAEAFERVEAEEMGEGVHEQYHQLAHELAEH